MRMPPLITQRLLIRPFVEQDLDAIHRLLDITLATAEFGTEGAMTIDVRRRWLEWTILGYEQFAVLNQPPYGDRCIILRQNDQFLGACGYTPCLSPFEQVPAFASTSQPGARFTSEIGLYYALDPAYQGHGYATEAAGALVDYAFETLNLKRIVATTTHDNAASMGVMRRLGMRIERNLYPEPSWLQVVGVRDNVPAEAVALDVQP